MKVLNHRQLFVHVCVNGNLVIDDFNCIVSQGHIDFQAEEQEVECRKMELRQIQKLPKMSKK